MQTASLTREATKINTKMVKILLIQRGLRPVDLARNWGVTRSAVSQVIHGKRRRSLLLGKLALALGVRLSDLLEISASESATKRDVQVRRSATKRDVQVRRSATKRDVQVRRSATKRDVQVRLGESAYD